LASVTAASSRRLAEVHVVITLAPLLDLEQKDKVKTHLSQCSQLLVRLLPVRANYLRTATTVFCSFVWPFVWPFDYSSPLQAS
jgi:hypothetical protein